MQEGRIMKALSGFYYVEKDGKWYTCKGRGVFRNKKITPLVGDIVDFDWTGEDEGYITKVQPRKNELVRPPVANVTQGIVVTSIVQPDFNPLLLDRFLVLFESKHITPVLLFTKQDLADEKVMTRLREAKAYYESIGYQVFLSDNTETAAEQVKKELENEVTVLAGQSGAGKSTLLNELDPAFNLETKAISTSLGRGKHTTRHVELFAVNGGLVADTPGFSSLDFPNLNIEELADCFIEFKNYKDSCRFRGCLHHKEPNCAVKTAVEEQEIAAFRYEHYLKFLQEIQMRKPRY